MRLLFIFLIKEGGKQKKKCALQQAQENSFKKLSRQGIKQVKERRYSIISNIFVVF